MCAVFLQADVLVNPIAKFTRKLDKAGYVSSAMLAAAGATLQEVGFKTTLCLL